jgi:AcrR family transcriptional regulator
MARSIPESRLKDLLDCATRVFIAQGYRRTQIADVAAALGIAKGTVYLYVESKEALFAAALRHADAEAPPVSELDLPLAAPEPGALVRELRDRVRGESIPDALASALVREAESDTRSELEGIVRQLFRLASRHRTGIELVDSCARDHPELAAMFYAEGRFAQLSTLVRYLEARIHQGRIPPLLDVPVAARFVVETIATWAVHIHWDPAPQSIDPELVESSIVQLVVGGLVGPPSERPPSKTPTSGGTP